jgi:glutathione S-transferase
MLVLEEKGLSGYGNKLLHFDKKEHKSDEVLKWNPRGQLPTMVVDNSFAINESQAIADYLEKVYSKQGTQLTPEDPKLLAKMLQLKHELSNLDTKGRDYIHYKFYKAGSSDGTIDETKAAKLLSDFKEELKIWDKYASQGDYLVGDKLTLADLFMFTNIALYVRLGLNLANDAPNVAKFYDRMSKLPSVVKTWPPHWKEGTAPAAIF